MTIWRNDAIITDSPGHSKIEFMGPQSLVLQSLAPHDYNLTGITRYATSPAVVLPDELPVDQLVQHGIHIVGTTILIIQIVSMHPHVKGKEWLQACCQRDFGIVG